MRPCLLCPITPVTCRMNAVIPKRKDGMVILETPKWNPIRQANFVVSLNKIAVDQAKKRYLEIALISL